MLADLLAGLGGTQSRAFIGLKWHCRFWDGQLLLRLRQEAVLPETKASTNLTPLLLLPCCGSLNRTLGLKNENLRLKMQFWSADHRHQNVGGCGERNGELKRACVYW